MGYERPIILSIAGFDPCGGAGVLADIKTFEQNRCLGMAVNSALTCQIEDQCLSVDWFSSEEILKSMKPLFERYAISGVKIGIMANLEVLDEVLTFLKDQNENMKIVWDPVLSASSGLEFITNLDRKKLEGVLKKVYAITPNVDEAKKLSGLENETDAAKFLNSYCNVLLKGGHRETEKGTDILFFQQQERKIEAIDFGKLAPKHGSGCILSAALTANLALGHELLASCEKAKAYVEKSLKSNSNLLAYHVV